ncbi:pimeloyl-ACP methyl ester carboxylesterase [Krasilnikovia cinnamomea]|uniref:Pimeloyl-ACP methyl ester carboxylesterase n=1 Tax=Krasilnikovia cinnamomea TaxID=349313 RepID=A0A4Q7ZS56_9ACTN|nr:alpha/beta fold hydrolase [Krasilnikovia cinnamomea]RZU54007.1 pimeloyl-ACP methyl ester carboxylesterase [Krasilnikovia cinnamomea]
MMPRPVTTGTPVYRSAEGADAVRRRYRAALADWPVPAQQITVPTGQGDTFVLACGPADAPPVLALQGSGANTAMWRHQIGTWARDLRVYAVDVIGEPGLSAPSRPPLESDAHARWLDEVTSGLGLAEVAMVGVSLGGLLAIDYALRRPGRVSRLALLSPSGIGRRRTRVVVAALALRPFGEAGRRRLLRYLLGPATPGRPTDSALPLLIFRHFRPRTTGIPTFSDARLAGLTMPVMVMLGGRDRMLDSHGTARRLSAAAPHAVVRLLPEAGHLLPDPAVPVRDFLLGGGQ